MEFTGLTPGEEFLRDAARGFFADIYESPVFYENVELDKNLEWTPALRFQIHEHINVFVEPSEAGPYPKILEVKQLNVLHFPQPISIYAVCPEELILKPDKRREAKILRERGFGLLTVDEDGSVHREFSASPLVQVIPKAEYKEEISGLPKKIRQRLGEAYEDYCGKPVNGVKSITEIIEGFVARAAKDAVKKTWLSNGDIKTTTANLLELLDSIPQCRNGTAAIGGVKSHYKEYRHLNHHWPSDKKRAYKKYSACKKAFIEGIGHIRTFREAMRNAGLSGDL